MAVSASEQPAGETVNESSKKQSLRDIQQHAAGHADRNLKWKLFSVCSFFLSLVTATTFVIKIFFKNVFLCHSCRLILIRF